MARITAPTHLKAATKRWYKQVLEDYELEPHHMKILTLAATSWDRAQDARELIDKEGAIIPDRFGSPKKHPAVDVEKDSMITFARLVRELALDIEPPKAPGRPPGLY